MGVGRGHTTFGKTIIGGSLARMFGAVRRQKLQYSFVVFQYNSVRVSLFPCPALKHAGQTLGCFTLVNSV